MIRSLPTFRRLAFASALTLFAGISFAQLTSGTRDDKVEVLDAMGKFTCPTPCQPQRADTAMNCNVSGENKICVDK